MNYTFEDMSMTGYKVLHPAINISASLYKVSQLAFTVLTLAWAYRTFPPLGVYFTAVAFCVWVYKLTWN